MGRCRSFCSDKRITPLVRKSNVISGNAGAWTTSAGTNADDSEWIVSEAIDDWTGLYVLTTSRNHVLV